MPSSDSEKLLLWVIVALIVVFTLNMSLMGRVLQGYLESLMPTCQRCQNHMRVMSIPGPRLPDTVLPPPSYRAECPGVTINKMSTELDFPLSG